MKIIVSLLLAASAAVATPAMAAPGPYVGVGVTHDNISTGGDLEGAGVNGIGGTVFAGYKLPVGESYYAAIEANFDIASAKIGDDEEQLKADHYYGASALLGFNVNDSTALYGRVGYQRGRTTERFEGEKFSYSRDGLRFGAGLETKLSDRLSLRAEYNRTHYYLSAADEAEIAPLKSGANNDQFALSIVAGF